MFNRVRLNESIKKIEFINHRINSTPKTESNFMKIFKLTIILNKKVFQTNVIKKY